VTVMNRFETTGHKVIGKCVLQVDLKLCKHLVHTEHGSTSRKAKFWVGIAGIVISSYHFPSILLSEAHITNLCLEGSEHYQFRNLKGGLL
jgi:hypothetical protein